LKPEYAVVLLLYCTIPNHITARMEDETQSQSQSQYDSEAYMAAFRALLNEDTARLESERRRQKEDAEKRRIQEEQRIQREQTMLIESVLAAEKDRAQLNKWCKKYVIEFVLNQLYTKPNRCEEYFELRIFYGELYDKARCKSTYLDGMLQLVPPNKSSLEQEIELHTFSYKPTNYDARLLEKYEQLGIHINTWRDDVLSWLTELFTDTAYKVKNKVYKCGFSWEQSFCVLISKKNQTDKKLKT